MGAGKLDPGYIARRDTPVTRQAGLRACEWIMTILSGRLPMPVLIDTVADDSTYSLTVAGAAPELPCPVWPDAPASRFTLNTVIFRAPVAKS